MKYYLLTLSSYTPGMDRFLKSMKNLGDNYEHIAVQFCPYVHMETKTYLPFPYPGHLPRHLYIPDDLDLNRYVIFSDTDDVVFQSPFPEFTGDIYLAPENVKHQDTVWNQYLPGTEFEVLADKEIFNCGLYVMKASILYQYKQFLIGYKHMGFEGLPFNMFLLKHPEFQRTVDLSILCPLFKNVELGNVVNRNNLWETVEGKVINCVHSNGIKRLH